MSTNEPSIRASAARVSLDCAHGDRLSVEALLAAANAEPLKKAFLAISARYIFGEGGIAGSPPDACSGFAACHRGLVGDEIAGPLVTSLQERLGATRAMDLEPPLDR